MVYKGSLKKMDENIKTWPNEIKLYNIKADREFLNYVPEFNPPSRDPHINDNKLTEYVKTEWAYNNMDFIYPGDILYIRKDIAKERERLLLDAMESLQLHIEEEITKADIYGRARLEELK